MRPSRIQRHLTVIMEYKDTGMPVTSTLFFFFLSLTQLFLCNYCICLGASIFLIPFLIPYLNCNAFHSPPCLEPVTFISPCPKSLVHFMTFDFCLFSVPKPIFLHFVLAWIFSPSLTVSLFCILVKLLLIRYCPVICRKKAENI